MAKKQPGLTPRQKDTLDFILQTMVKYSRSPTFKEIADGLGVTPAIIQHHVRELEKKGVLSRAYGVKAKSRSFKVDEKYIPPRGLPLLGQVAAGVPVLAEENIEEYIDIKEYVNDEEGDFLLRISGQSMKDAGIMEGDIVVVRSQKTAKNGDIVVALVDGTEATVKRFFKEKDHIRLQPENKSFKPITSKEVTILGKVLTVIRKVG